jgi:hypothetical protein
VQQADFAQIPLNLLHFNELEFVSDFGFGIRGQRASNMDL